MSGFEQLFPGTLPKLVMFDLDGTLIDSVPDLAAAIDRMLVALGRPPAGLEAVRQWVGNGAEVLVRRALAGSLEHAQVNDADAAHGLELFMQAYDEPHTLTTLYPGVVDTLRWLNRQGVEMALITNKPERFVGPLLDQMKLGRYFRWIIGGDTLPQKKPDPAALLRVMQMAGAQPGESLFVGDSRSDVLAAKAAGVPCAALSYGYNHGRPIEEESPSLVIDDLRALVPGCVVTDSGITLTPLHASQDKDPDVMVNGTLWMKVIKALARWRWRA